MWLDHLVLDLLIGLPYTTIVTAQSPLSLHPSHEQHRKLSRVDAICIGGINSLCGSLRSNRSYNYITSPPPDAHGNNISPTVLKWKILVRQHLKYQIIIAISRSNLFRLLQERNLREYNCYETFHCCKWQAISCCIVARHVSERHW